MLQNGHNVLWNGFDLVDMRSQQNGAKHTMHLLTEKFNGRVVFKICVQELPTKIMQCNFV